MVTRTQHPPRVAAGHPTDASDLFATAKRSSSKGSKVISGTRDLPMPHVTRISHLNQAHATLLHCWSKLSRFTQEASTSGLSASRRASIDEERRQFQHWLNQWEAAFTAYLSSAMASMTAEDITHSRILKTNHLACTIMASDADPSSFDVFDAEFQAIVELAGAVLRSRNQAESLADNMSSASDSSSVSAGLDVQEPLKVLLSHCRQNNIRARAGELYSRFYLHDGA